MANFKRKRPKKRLLRDCNVGCKYDGSKYTSINGFTRYPPMYWKHVGGRQAWRYAHKNVVVDKDDVRFI